MDDNIVVRGFLVPVLDEEGKPTYVKTFDAEEIRGLWQKFIEKIRKVLKFVFKDHKASTIDDLNKLNNVIVLFIKACLYMDPLPGFAYSPQVLLFYQSIYDKELRESFGEEYDSFKHEAAKFIEQTLRIEILREPWEELLKTIDESRKIVRDTFMRIPADTRPVANTSSLLTHLLATSAIASSIYKSRVSDFSELDHEILRLASLLHDVGKPFSWEKHVATGINLIKNFLGDFVEEKILEKVIDLVKKHHGEHRDTLCRILVEADRISSNIDRIKDFLFNRREISKKIDDICKKIDPELSVEKIKDNWDSWEFWKGLGVSTIRKLTEEMIKILETLSFEDDGRKIEGEVLAVKLDVRGIQSYITEANRLAEIVGGSRIVDNLIMWWVPFELLKNKIPPENVIYSGGGNILLICSNKDLGKVRSLCKVCSEEWGLEVAIGSEPIFKGSIFRKVLNNLESSLALEKMKIFGEGEEIIPGLAFLCQSCYRRPATIKSKLTELRLCETCNRRLEYGITNHFKARWASMKIKNESLENIFGLTWDCVREHLIELIAGHEPDEIKKMKENSFSEEYLNIAVVKVDGNLMGSFLAKSISISDLMDRSTRIDLALKKGFRRIEEVLDVALGNEAKKWIARLRLGLMYCGGDDALLLCPSWLTPAITVILATEFTRELGFSATLSVGVAANMLKQPIWGLFEASERLLKFTKKEYRKREIKGEVHIGAVTYEVVETGAATGDYVDYSVNYLRRNNLTTQPLTILNEPEKYSFKLLLDYLWGLLEGLDYNQIVQNSYATYRYYRFKDRNLLGSRTDNIRKELIEVLKQVLFRKKEGKIKAISYIMRKYGTIDKEKKKEILPIIFRTLVGEGDQNLIDSKIAALDLYKLIKLLSGGYA